MQIVTVTPSKRPEFWQYLAENIVLQKRKPDYSILLIDREEQCPTLDFETYLRYWNVCPVIIRNPDDNVVSGHLLNICFAAAERLIKTGMICLLEDDNLYGENYLAEAAGALVVHPDAVIIGKLHVRTRWMDGSRPPKYPEVGDPENPGLGLGGGTISMNVEGYRKYPSIRFDENDPYGDVSIMKAFFAEGLKVRYTSEENFWYQRWGKEHGHLWKCGDMFA